MRTLCLVVVALLATACSGGSSAGDPVRPEVTPATASTPASNPTTSSPASPGTQLVVLGDSMASPTACGGCRTFPEQVAAAMARASGSEVEVVDLAWALGNPKPAQVADILDYVRTDELARDALAGAEAVVVFVAQNDLAYNRGDDPCGVAPAYPRVRWDELTHACMDAVLREYEQDLDALLDEVDELRDGRPTVLRIVTAFNSVIGDLVDPTWNSPAAVEPSTYNVSRMVQVQCRLAVRHGGRCADVFHVLNGPDGSRSAMEYLNPADATHPAQPGHDAIAEVVTGLGFRPLER